VTSVLQGASFTAVMVLGLAVILGRNPLRQALVNGVFGFSLVILFLVLQAPDVGLSELVVGTVAFPLILLATIARTKGDQRPQ
jgi:energy-converting hydrogenase B subunit D